ncbi:hypothetical protein PsorP6_003178 [Peronosclerospora sorghi]|uniref:Uncharacterized protein n=1 Tax=Peronosclerospora sorghi TaxID=230839 RepID=A0ACC0VMD7_9STRA|nr:hypothetical protein PsorP6_003178 [Peronosclerospora sorghi]
MFFFARIRNGGVRLYDGDEEIRWPVGMIQVVNPRDLSELLPTGWLKPHKYNQGGYDAIFVEKATGLVRFVQVTKAHSHTFHIGYFNQFLCALRDSGSSFVVKTLESSLLLKEMHCPIFSFPQSRALTRKRQEMHCPIFSFPQSKALTHGLPTSRLHLSHASVSPGAFVASGSHIADDSALVHAGAGLSSHATLLRLAMALLLRRVLMTFAGTLDLACSSVWRCFVTMLATSHALLDPSPSFHTSFGIHLALGGCQLLASTLSPFRLGFPSFRRRFHSTESPPFCLQ